MPQPALIRNPSAFLPLAMSVSALALVVAFLAAHGPAPQPDEGAAARLWQLLMAAQIPIIFYFAVTWLPQFPKRALAILAVQVAAALMAAAPVMLLGW